MRGRGLMSGPRVAAVLLVGAVAATVWAIIAPWRLITKMREPPSDLTLWATAVGCRWRYTYSIPQGRIEIPAATCATNMCRLGLDPTKAAVVPVDRTVRLIVASEADQPHDLAVPSLGLAVTAVPGAIRERWFQVLREGAYVGSSSGACAKDPDRVPIGIRGIAARDWDAWFAAHRPVPR